MYEYLPEYINRHRSSNKIKYRFVLPEYLREEQSRPHYTGRNIFPNYYRTLHRYRIGRTLVLQLDKPCSEQNEIKDFTHC